MKKKIFSSVILLTIKMIINAQTISPIESTEFCPETNISFKVALPLIKDNTVPSLSSWTNNPIIVSTISNLTNTSTQTTFNFVGKFRDVNIAQTFKVDYIKRSDGAASTAFFTYKSIKSLFYDVSSSTSCPRIIPNPASITVPRCQVVNTPISFTNVKWNTYGETPAFCFGAITTYEYLLPINWSIGLSISDGSTWIPGGSSVTITSDLSNGVGGFIRVRPRNSCNTTYANGIIPSTISILRPEPVLSVSSGNNNAICLGSTKDYTITGMPVGATISWRLESTTNATIQGSNTNPTVTVRNNNGNNIVVNLIGTVTHCSFKYDALKKIILGVAKAEYININNGPCPEYTVSTSSDFCTGRCATYTWSFRNTSNNSQLQSFPNSSYARRLILDQGSGNYYLGVQINNNCGVGQVFSISKNIVCNLQGISVSPNPAKGNIQIKSNSNEVFTEVIIVDKMGVIKRSILYLPTKQASLDISSFPNGIYNIKVLLGNYYQNQQFIKQ